MRCVIKLGGSLHVDPGLKDWLAMLVEYGPGKTVIVPGGGAFADAVRAAQRVWKFADAAAHRMALLAMDQFAIQLQSIEPRLVLADSRAALLAALNTNRVALWLPSAMVLAEPSIPASWDVTSDSLAAWIAKRIGAMQLVLVKSCEVQASDAIAELARKEIVDGYFLQMLGDADFAVDVVYKTNLQAVQRVLEL